MTAQCPICGNTKFGRGPNGRSGINGTLPWCAKCGSLERHRALHVLWQELRPISRDKKALQISFEPTFGEGGDYFASLEKSIYGGENSLDIQAINRPANSYDIVICNHVLEHVPDDRAAFGELLRICGNGVLELMVPMPLRLAATTDWGKPDKSNHGHYRVYGADMWQRFDTRCHVLEVNIQDPVTMDDDLAFFIARESWQLAPYAQKIARKLRTRFFSLPLNKIS